VRRHADVVSRCFALVIGAALAASSWTVAMAQEVVTVGHSKTISDAPFFIADKEGYFRREGIEVSLQFFNSAAYMIAPLGTGQLDSGGGAVSAGLYNAAGRDIKIRIVADKAIVKPGYVYVPLLVRKDLVESGRYKTLRDLEGMKVAIGGPGTGTESLLNEALKKGGRKIGNVDLVYMGFPDHLVGFQNKNLEASVTTEPTASLMLREGLAYRVPENDAIYPNQQAAVLLYSEVFIEKRRAVAQKFMRAYMKGVRDYVDALKDGSLSGPNAARVIATLIEYTNIKDPEVYRRLVPSAVNPDGLVNVETLKKDLAYFNERKLIENADVTVEQVIDHSFVNEAVRQLGPYRAKATQ
jgi:NitT/TauT family transport system substrate-binding protein